MLILFVIKDFVFIFFKQMVCKLSRNKPSQVILVGVVGTNWDMHFRPSVCLVAKLVFGRLFALHSFVYSFICRSFSCYCLCRGHPSVMQTPIKVSKCIKTYREPKLLCFWSNIKEDIPTVLEVFLCFETKRNETKHKQILHENTHAAREVISAEELGTMS